MDNLEFFVTATRRTQREKRSILAQAVGAFHQSSISLVSGEFYFGLDS